MLELQAVPTDVVGCYAHPAVLDRLGGSKDLGVRVAPDELLLLSARDRLTELEAELGVVDANGVVIDLSSAFSIWVLRGDDRLEAFCRLSELELPPPRGVIQGLVAHVPAKVVVRDDELLLIVSSALAHHVRERVLGACADLSPVEVALAPAEVETAALA